jgi:5-(carboxyamino)imidazole ribonucleotide mutase
MKFASGGQSLKVIIIMGSDSDLDFSTKISDFIKKFDVDVEMRIASAHKTPEKALGILKDNEENEIVYVTVAGRSNALSAFADANTSNPVIACPPLKKDKFDTDLFSSLSMPSGVAPMTVLYPQNAALAALKVIALSNKDVKKKIQEFQGEFKTKIEKKDSEVSNG